MRVGFLQLNLHFSCGGLCGARTMADQKEPAKDVPADAQSEGYKKLMEAIEVFKAGKDLGPLPLNLKMNWNTDDEWWCPYYHKDSIFVDENTSEGEDSEGEVSEGEVSEGEGSEGEYSEGEGSDNRGCLQEQK